MVEYLESLKNLILVPIRQSEPKMSGPAAAKTLATLAGGHLNLLRIAGVSGALAVGLGAYGAHTLRDKEEVSRDRKSAFDAANRYHLLHTVALMGTPLCYRPYLTGSLFIAGMLLFSGSCYYHAITGRTEFKQTRVTPMGGMLLIAAWLSMIF